MGLGGVVLDGIGCWGEWSLVCGSVYAYSVW